MNSSHLFRARFTGAARLALFGLVAASAGAIASAASADSARTPGAAPRVVLISGEYEYSSTLTLPALRSELEHQLGFRAVYLQRTAGEHIPGLEAIDNADLVIGIIRRMTLPADELNHFKRYLDSGRPLIGMRTMCHAFENWKEFDHDVLGGNYHAHSHLGAATPMRLSEPEMRNPLLAGVPDRFTAEGELYKVQPLAADAVPLVWGTEASAGAVPEPTAWTHSYHGARIFFTSMGHPADFNNPAFMRLLTNAIFWALNRPAPAAPLASLGGFPVLKVGAGELAHLADSSSFKIFDLRPPADYHAGHVPNATDLDPASAEYPARVAALVRSEVYVLYGAGSAPSELAAELHRRGFPFVYEFSDGFGAWREAGMPISRADGPEPAKIDLWPEGVPGFHADATPEKIADGRAWNIHHPYLSAYPAPLGKRAQTAVIICPGGGYTYLAIDNNGTNIAAWLNTLGISAYVLHYRLQEYGHPAPLRDVLRAIRMVRSRAVEFGVKPDRVGVFGASAGGHLAACAATMYDDPEGRTGAELDKVSARPDFTALLYPLITMTGPYVHAVSVKALLGANPPPGLAERLSAERRVTKDTPPVFIAHTEEDKSVLVENSLMFYQALRTAGVPVEMHLWAKGAHGFGMRKDIGEASTWPDRCEEWLRANGWLDVPKN
jgi:acetyl esterase/lipase/type 1 glutamine amidotransferase